MAMKIVTLDGLTQYHAKNVGLLNGKVDKAEGMGLSANDFTDEYKAKVDSIAEGGQVNVIEVVQVNGSALPITAKTVNVDLSAYALKSDLTAVYRYQGNVATYDALPTEGMVVGDVYNVEEDGSNYAWNGTAWDDLAGVVDLTGYYTKTEVDATVKTINDAVALKANSADVYTKTDIDGKVSTINTAIGTKANSSDVYIKSEIDAKVSTINTAIDAKANSADVYTKTQTYTKSEVDGLIADVEAGMVAVTTDEINAMFA